MMDWLRNLLIISIAICGWFLVVQWQKDYSQQDIRIAQGVSQELGGVSNQGVPTLSEDLVSVANPQSDKLANPLEALPEIQPEALVDSSSGNSLVEIQEAKPEVQLLKVITDVYEIHIDPRGGDIVHAGLLGYPVSLEHPEIPFLIFQNQPGKKYLAQSGIVGLTGTDLDHGSRDRPIYNAPKKLFELESGQTELKVPLTFVNDQGVEFRKIYLFNPGSYEIKVQYKINNLSDKDWLGRFYGRIIRNGYDDPTASSGFGMQTFLGGAYLDLEDKFEKIGFADIDEAIEENRLPLKQDKQGGWIALLQHYFLAAFVPEAEKMNSYKMFSRKDLSNYSEYILEVAQPATSVPARSTAEIEMSLYVGPKIQEELKKIAPGLNLAVDYGFLFFISDALFMVLNFLNSFIGNWGWSIILLTFFIKLGLYPLSAKSYRSMAQMRKVQPKLLELRDKYGDDKQKMSQELMKLYQKEKINPLGGCWPLLVQMPIFIALYWMLLESVELRQAPFVLWIEDLSVMDPYFILPLLMGASMWFQQKMHPEPPDPTQAKIMKLMPIFMTFLFLFFPSGLVLYWVTNNFLSIIQQWYNTKQYEAA